MKPRKHNWHVCVHQGIPKEAFDFLMKIRNEGVSRIVKDETQHYVQIDVKEYKKPTASKKDPFTAIDKRCIALIENLVYEAKQYNIDSILCNICE